jgi:DNA-binding SARP family transcriptional activator/DNA-binding Lrp family transcriptional regulator
VDVLVRVLGPVEIDRGNGTLDRVRGLTARLLLALIVDRGRGVTDDELVDRLWPDGAPRHAMASVRNQVARIRRTYGSTLIDRTPNGYRVGARLPVLDVDRLDAALVQARDLQHEPARALTIVDDALGLVRGRPLHEVADDLWAMPSVAAITERLAGAEELWAALSLATAPAAADLSRLRRLALAQPQREVRWRYLVAALAGADQRTDAVRALGEARRALAEFGMTPGAELLGLERELLGIGARPVRRLNRVPARRDPMVGREAQLAALLHPGRAAWVHGDPGTGKTRLLAELADRVDAGEVALLYVDTPRVAGRDTGIVPALLAAVDELSPAEAPLVDAVADRDPAAWRIQLAGAIVAGLRAAAASGEVVVVVDDVQWLDGPSATTLGEVAVRTADVVRWIFAGRSVEHQPDAAALLGDLERSGAVHRIELGNLTAAEVRALVAEVATELDDVAGDRLARDVMRATYGHPLSVAEVVAHRDRIGEEPLPRLDAIVSGMLSVLDATDQRLVELLSVAGGPCSTAVLAAAAGCSPSEVLERGERLAAEGLVRTGGGQLDLRHDAVRAAVARQLAPGREAAARRDLVRELAKDPRAVVSYADQLLRSEELLAEHADDRDPAVVRAIGLLLADVEFAAAARLATRYLAVAPDPAPGTAALAAHVAAATALIATEDVARARSILLQLLGPVRASGDLPLLADAILAMGPLTTGRREPDELLADAERLVAELGPGEGRRRVELACWAAHQRLLRGHRLRAESLLDLADADPYSGVASHGLVLAMRAQAEMLVDARPGALRRAMEQLRTHVARHPGPTARAALAVLEVREAWSEGTLADVAAVRDRIAEIAAVLPRPDVRWWPLALDAAIELAAGRLDRAADAIELAARFGRELKVEAAAPTAQAQQLALLWANGAISSAVDALESFAAGPSATLGMVAGYGLACAEAGDVAAAGAVADRLMVEPELLRRAGASWMVLAMCATEVAVATRRRDLAAVLREGLERHRGIGLTSLTVGYFGTVDRCLGRLATVTGDRARAVELLEGAVVQERRRGTAMWERRTVADLWAATHLTAT